MHAIKFKQKKQKKKIKIFIGEVDEFESMANN